jgi:hypothetical protein
MTMSRILRAILMIALLGLTVLTTACTTIGGMTKIGCSWVEGQDYYDCLKFAAVQDNDKDSCAAIPDEATKALCYAEIDQIQPTNQEVVQPTSKPVGKKG